MRLPTVTVKQHDNEDARELHEAIWFAHLAGKAYLLPGAPEPFKSDRAARVAGNLNSFWLGRGYRLSVTLTESRRIAVRLTATEAKQRVVIGDVDLTWNQPGVR